jgi:hypothetical protein
MEIEYELKIISAGEKQVPDSVSFRKRFPTLEEAIGYYRLMGVRKPNVEWSNSPLHPYVWTADGDWSYPSITAVVKGT